MIAAGCRFVAVGTDVSVLMRGARSLLRAYTGSASTTSEAVPQPRSGY
jgi:hypothetical protein